MKSSTFFSSLAVLLPLISQATGAHVLVFPRGGGHRGGGQKGGGNAGNVTNVGGNAGNVTNVGGNAGNVTNAGGNAGNVTNAGGNAGGDPQTSLTLDPRVIAPGFANDGQGTPVAGQVASKTSTNNFINFCLTAPGVALTNGQQIAAGSCNPAPMGLIPSSGNMPSSKFTNPKNGDTISSNQAFTITMAISNLATGNFVNAQQNYFSAPQQLDGGGKILGHSHVVVELLSSLTQTTPSDPTKFAFFKGLNNAASNGVLSAAVANGLPAGAYRLCSINTAANHQPVLVPIAQHGALDDCVYFTAAAGGAGNNTATPATPGGNAGNTTAAPAATSTPAASGGNAGNATSTPATGGGKNGGNGKAGGKRDVSPLRRRFHLY